MNWIVYILKCADDSLYTGITNDLAKRIRHHELGAGAKYTRGRGPFDVVYQEICTSRSEATKREIKIKKLSHKQKLALKSLAKSNSV